MYWNNIMLALLACNLLGCTADKERDWPKFPLCFEEMGRGSLAEREYFTTNIQPIALKEVLLLPYYASYNWRGRVSERVVARPFLYRPETPLVVPSYRPGFKLRGIVAVVPGYFGAGVCTSRDWVCVGKIDGVECQLEEIMKARDRKEADRILLDFKYLLSQKEVTLGTTRNPLTIGENERHVYALSTDFMTPCDHAYLANGGSFITFRLWYGCGHGTKLSVDLTAAEIKMVNGFFDKYLKMDSLETDKRPVVTPAQRIVGQ